MYPLFHHVSLWVFLGHTAVITRYDHYKIGLRAWNLYCGLSKPPCWASQWLLRNLWVTSQRISSCFNQSMVPGNYFSLTEWVPSCSHRHEGQSISARPLPFLWFLMWDGGGIRTQPGGNYGSLSTWIQVHHFQTGKTPLPVGWLDNTSHDKLWSNHSMSFNGLHLSYSSWMTAVICRISTESFFHCSGTSKWVRVFKIIKWKCLCGQSISTC